MNDERTYAEAREKWERKQFRDALHPAAVALADIVGHVCEQFDRWRIPRGTFRLEVTVNDAGPQIDENGFTFGRTDFTFRLVVDERYRAVSYLRPGIDYFDARPLVNHPELPVLLRNATFEKWPEGEAEE